WDLDQAGGLRNTGKFFLALQGPTQQVYEFADSAWGGDPNGVFAGLGQLYGDKSLSATAAVAPTSFQAPLQLLWRDPSIAAATATGALDAAFD
ncbi:hypothetical protein, partial [Klebsiella pneumoniae]|uniref:hypothetical protein n=1 Tax=Klebsiella pneumoniae TaxID=573 RepID=UPI0038523046